MNVVFVPTSDTILSLLNNCIFGYEESILS